MLSRHFLSRVGALTTLLLLCSALPAAAQTSHRAEDAKAIANYTLTLAKVKAFYAATRAMEQLEESDTALAERVQARSDAADENESLAQAAARFESEPKLKAVLAAHGLTGREYMLITFAMMQASLAESLSGGNPHAAPPKGVNAKNVAFMRAHDAELKKMAEAAGFRQE